MTHTEPTDYDYGTEALRCVDGAEALRGVEGAAEALHCVRAGQILCLAIGVVGQYLLDISINNH